MVHGLVSQPMEVLMGKLGRIKGCAEVLGEGTDGGLVDGAALLINNEEQRLGTSGDARARI